MNKNTKSSPLPLNSASASTEAPASTSSLKDELHSAYNAFNQEIGRTDIENFTSVLECVTHVLKARLRKTGLDGMIVCTPPSADAADEPMKSSRRVFSALDGLTVKDAIEITNYWRNRFADSIAADGAPKSVVKAMRKGVKLVALARGDIRTVNRLAVRLRLAASDSLQ